jgi:hypothetical protein
MSAQLDFKSLSADLLADSRNVLPRWLPGGKTKGKEFICGSLAGDAGGSLSINVNTGVWKDFATGETGADLIDLYAAIHSMTLAEAYRELTGQHQRQHTTRVPPPPPVPQRHVICPVPSSADLHECVHPVHGRPSRVWQYENQNGELMGYVARYDPPNERKQIVPWTYTPEGWSAGQWPEPRPLYGLQHLAERPGHPVLLVEGEKSVDAAIKFAKEHYVVVTWPGGGQAWTKVDFSPLHGREVILWPDADLQKAQTSRQAEKSGVAIGEVMPQHNQPGWITMQGIAAHLSPHCKVKLIDPGHDATRQDGWDAADSGFTWSDFLAWAKPRAQLFVPEKSTDGVADPETGEITTHPDYTGAPYVTPEAAQKRAPIQFTHTPMDLFSETPAPELRPEWLPPAIANYAFDQAELLAVSPAMIAIPALVACASAIHDGIEVQPKRYETSWRESARLWCAVVGPPSVRKSPSLKRATSRLRKINKELCEANEANQSAYQAQSEDYKELKKLSKKTGDPLPAPPEEPVKSRMIVEDVTVEALSEILKHNSRGVLCIQDELTGWFGSMDAYSGGKSGNKDRAHWLEIYNGGHRMVDRVMRGNVSIPNWSACMIGGIQPDMMRKVASQMGEDGLMQRFMVIMGKNTGKEMDRQEDTQSKADYSRLIDSLYSLQPSPNPVLLTEEAHIVRERIADMANSYSEYGALPGGLRSHMGKWTGLFARLLLTYHVIDCATRGVFPTAQPIPESTALQVESLMSNFLYWHSLSFYNDVMTAQSDLEHVRWLAGHVLAHSLTEITNRDITQAYRAWRGIDEFRRQRIMMALEDGGWLNPTGELTKTFRKPSEWVVNPQVHEIFESIALSEREKRSETRKQIENARASNKNNSSTKSD